MLLQRLGEFALQRETALANPLITAQDIKQEALDEVEEAARNEAQRLREDWQKRKDAGNKLQQKFVGPYYVIAAYNNQTYNIERQ